MGKIISWLERAWKWLKTMDMRKAWKCLKMAMFVYRNRNSLEERWLNIWVEVEDMYDQMFEEWETL